MTTWYEKNKEISIARAKQWALDNPEKVKERYQKKKDRPEFKARKAEYFKEWSARNKGRVAHHSAMRRANLAKATIKSLTEWDTFYIEELYDIAAKRGLSVDHIIPIKHDLVSGLHVPENLQLLPLSENSRKHNNFELC